jgi:copper chaperone CopZ
MVNIVYCVHCGAVAKHPVTKLIDGQALSFCCNGCLQVFEMMREESLLAGQAAAVPGERNEGDTLRTITLPVTGMNCGNCAAAVQRSLKALPGVSRASVDLAAAQVTLELLPEVKPADLQRAVRKAGYDLIV